VRPSTAGEGGLNRIADVNGILIVDKPAGMTSHDVVDRVRRLFRTKRVGHTGTLDPDATGVLVLCLGSATRLAEYLSASAKHYTTELLFGVRTDTMDASGSLLSERDASHLTELCILALLPAFRGKILQTPPMVSARHHQGRRLYELAREGVTVERQAQEVEIAQLDLTGFQSGPHPVATMEVTCSTGTYIRVLADDLGQAAGTGAIMRVLRRTWVGMDAATAFALAEAYSLADLDQRADHGSLASALIPLASALRAMPRVRVAPEGLRRLRQGQTISLSDVTDVSGPDLVDSSLAAVLDEHGGVCAIVRNEAEILRPTKVLSPNEAV
jgi:tRNA pseudouridine55 synthase